MFGLSDIIKFFLAFFVVLPLVSLIHEAGHIVAAKLMGAKKIKLSIGSGDVWFRFGILEVRKYYFLYGFCHYESLKYRNRYSHIFIFSGGFIFNSAFAIIVFCLIHFGVLKPSIISYQFIYFSFYYIFFDLLPMPYPNGKYSDGKIMIDLLLGRRMDGESTIEIWWNPSKQGWTINGDDQLFQR